MRSQGLNSEIMENFKMVTAGSGTGPFSVTGPCVTAQAAYLRSWLCLWGTEDGIRVKEVTTVPILTS